MTLDLSKFRHSFVKDSDEALANLVNMRKSRRIGEGSHEVVVTRIHEKNGEKVKLIEKFGGYLGFSIVAQNAENAEQMVYLSIPLQVNFEQASKEEHGFQFANTVRNIANMGLDPNKIREALYVTQGNAVDLFVGTQFIITNSWSSKKLHLEYDPGDKSYYFVTFMGDRVEEGELKLPIRLDPTLMGDERYKEAIILARSYKYDLAIQMDTAIKKHPTVNNKHINEAFEKVISGSVKPNGFVATTPKVLNTTKLAFADVVRKASLPTTE